MDAGLRPEEITSKQVVGWHDGCPVYLIETSGGFSMVLMLKNGKLEPLSAGPHPGVSKGLAKKRQPDIVWNQLAKSQDFDINSSAASRWESITNHLRGLLGFKK